MARTASPQIKKDIVEKVVSRCSTRGFHGLSLRDLAKRANTSHRMLLYHFGSREGLMREIITHFRMRRVSLVTANLASTKTWDEFNAALQKTWLNITASESRDMTVTFFEIYVTCLRERKDPQARAFLKAAEDDWVAPLALGLRKIGLSREKSRDTAFLILSAMRGMLLHEAASGRTSYTRKCFCLFLEQLRT